ncbi:MAG: NAD+ synthase [Bacteroidia bacterium]|uniref:NAD+ synthase n=1 Tax=Candidatus Pollutiaquabacter sp. TaxID=3416354 RepID=UPI001B52CE62|nr:NAD+ synthase [Bacteroidota bacterium]MBP7270138.1 NAD+ synthase [Bacteroidia bacterium]MBP7438105.1 NAD+ synthase [Bacteroidia bacterium]MBP7728278.1 NAD+ synthase [Bacteroidia bacterium]MBP7772523.1 NAD+ synthase [Bacteroidia bacterium]
MRIALAQLDVVIGDFEKNVARMREYLERAKAAGADLVVFPELAICGYPPRDFLEFRDFIERGHAAAMQLVGDCTDLAAIIGLPTVNPKAEGKNLFNSAWVIQDGKVTATVHKALLPTYDIFDEYRYFEPAREFQTVTVAGKKIALTICEDLWNVEDDPMYVSCPMDALIREKPDLMVNIAASPFSYDHAEQRKAILLRNVKQYGIPLVYVNHVGAQTEIIFDGGSLAMDRTGTIVSEAAYFEEDLLLVSLENDGQLTATKATDITRSAPKEKIERIYRALVLGIRDYFRKQGFRTATLGLSGGIDSAVVTCLAADALGPENVKVLLMPSGFSSEGSVTDSLELIRANGVNHETIPIQSIFDAYLAALQPAFSGLPFNVAEENIQARIRGGLLMAQSNKFGSILLNTSNKSEIAVGYGTLYGDLCGGISVIGDVYKTDVFKLARFLNRDQVRIPEAIINKPPSAELRPNQKDSDSLPEYDILDPILFQYIEKRMSPSALVEMGNDPALVARILKLVNTNEYKRYQTPPILRVSPKAFGMGRRLPIVGKYLS